MRNLHLQFPMLEPMLFLLGRREAAQLFTLRNLRLQTLVLKPALLFLLGRRKAAQRPSLRRPRLQPLALKPVFCLRLCWRHFSMRNLLMQLPVLKPVLLLLYPDRRKAAQRFNRRNPLSLHTHHHPVQKPMLSCVRLGRRKSAQYFSMRSLLQLPVLKLVLLFPRLDLRKAAQLFNRRNPLLLHTPRCPVLKPVLSRVRQKSAQPFSMRNLLLEPPVLWFLRPDRRKAAQCSN